MLRFTASACAALAIAASASAQTSPLYVFDYNSGGTWIVQNGAITGSFTRSPYTGNSSANAIAGDIRTFGAQNGVSGYQYDLNGSYLGNTYTNTTGVSTFYDGTTDGQNHNYAFQWSGGDLWRFDRNWQNPVRVFDYNIQALGSAYHVPSGNIFASGNTQLWRVDTSGNILWTRNHQNNISQQYAVAYDPADNTVWTVGNSGNGVLVQYDENGNFLQQLQVNGMSGATLGAEFNIPAPGAAALLGLGTLAAARRRRA